MELAGVHLYPHRNRFAELAIRHRLPSMGSLREYAEAGCLMVYGASTDHLMSRSATYVDKILKGAMPGDLPVQEPTKFELVVNLKTAKALGIIIPPALLKAGYLPFPGLCFHLRALVQGQVSA